MRYWAFWQPSWRGLKLRVKRRPMDAGAGRRAGGDSQGAVQWAGNWVVAPLTWKEERAVKKLLGSHVVVFILIMALAGRSSAKKGKQSWMGKE